MDLFQDEMVRGQEMLLLRIISMKNYVKFIFGLNSSNMDFGEQRINVVIKYGMEE
jgi:hypothetical protein